MVEARQAEHLASLFEPSVGAVKLAEWDDKPLQFANALLGYILVYGYDFSVELVQMEDDAYQAAFQNGELDVMLTLDIDTAGDWYTTHIDGKGIVDLGSIRDGNGNIRLVVHSGLSERAPEVTAFLARAKPTDALIEKLSASIRGGRIGIKPTVPAIKFIKEQEGLWTQWVPVSVADKVKAAIAGGKTSLVNRKCIPDGGSGGGSNNCGT
jgi:ABC-type proline/glycine betaine transport system substrate-binding protein